MSPDLKIASFRMDVTPPPNHPLCGGWIQPVVGVDDPISLRGLVILGADEPIVLAAVDWTGVLNESFDDFRAALAQGAGTRPERATLHCVHQHNSLFVDQTGNALLKSLGVNTPIHDDAFFQDVLKRASATVKDALKSARSINRVGVGEAKVEQVACNRRVIGPNGKILYTRTSATRDPKARAEPEGTIDPTLRCVSLYHDDRPVARLHYYATHPMSYYGDGRVSSDFVGLARYRRQISEPNTQHVYFTGCAGNVTAGKYNDGSHVYRAILADRIENAMIAADAMADAQISAIDRADWRIVPFRFPARPDLNIDQSMAIIKNDKEATAVRNRNAMIITWLKRVEARKAIDLTALDLGRATSLHLPAETFIEYQLEATRQVQAADAGRTLAIAAYGDGGPWYIPIARAYGEGGYEPSVSFVSPESQPLYQEAIASVVKR